MRAAVVALALAGALGLAWRVHDTFDALARPVDRHGSAFAGSGACARCHPDHHASWARTHHRRMTQAATDETVLGAFDGRTLAYGGYLARMERAPDGRFVVDVERGGEFFARWTVERVVGSRRHQQLLAREDDLWVRLPIAWDVEAGRFFHMNGAFLTPDPEGLDAPAPIPAADFMRHAVRWNDNCVFCHNVGAEPRPLSAAGAAAGERWDTRVAELGVACEACHGPSAEHARLNQSPLRRYVLHTSDAGDPTTTAPSRLPRARQTDLCGRCHGQRITDDVSRYLAHGDPFVPGDDLARTSHPLAIDTPLHGDPSAFAPRFWRDGTPRLTAYEHQGVLQSRCGVTCGDCHAMHDYASVRGQLRADLAPGAAGDRDRMCAGTCHVALASPEAARAHARHDDVRCVDCHMPRIVYGIRSIHRSHRIEIPRPLEHERDARPDACTLCHVEQSAAWAARAIASHGTPERDDGRSRVEVEAFAGDPVERAVVARALGAPTAIALDERHRRGILLAIMRDDPYPAVRGIAWSSAFPDDRRFVPTDDRTTRAHVIEAVAAERGLTPFAPADADAMRARASARAIEIGE